MLEESDVKKATKDFKVFKDSAWMMNIKQMARVIVGISTTQRPPGNHRESPNDLFKSPWKNNYGHRPIVLFKCGQSLVECQARQENQPPRPKTVQRACKHLQQRHAREREEQAARMLEGLRK